MGLFERFPYTNFHELNASWLVKKMNELIEAMETFKATESLKFADPIIWDIATQYQKSTIVLDPTGNAYLSLQPVPAGVQLNNDDYWLEIFNFTDYTRTANKNLTVHVETNTTRATASYNVDDWLIWEDVLYKVTAAIAIDDALVVGTNLVHFTVEDFLKAFINYATGLIQQYKNDIDASELAYRNQLAQDITNTTATLQAQLNQAISGATVDSEVIDARIGANGRVYSTLGVAIRAQVTNLYNRVDSHGITGNFIPENYHSGDSLLNAGIQFTKQPNGAIYTNGTATGASRYYWINNKPIPAGTYTLTGIPSDASASTFVVQFALVNTGDPITDISYQDIIREEEITVGAGKSVAIRTKYNTGYVDTGHTWNLQLYPNDIQLLSSYNPDNFVPKIYQNESDVAQALSDINDIYNGSYEDSPVLSHSGEYINAALQVSSNASYNRTDPFLLKAGESIEIYTATSSNVVTLAQSDDYNKPFSKIIDTDTNGNFQTFNYTAPDNIYVILSLHASGNATITRMNGYVERILGLQSHFEEYNVLKPYAFSENTKLELNVGDSIYGTPSNEALKVVSNVIDVGAGNTANLRLIYTGNCFIYIADSAGVITRKITATSGVTDYSFTLTGSEKYIRFMSRYQNSDGTKTYAELCMLLINQNLPPVSYDYKYKKLAYTLPDENLTKVENYLSNKEYSSLSLFYDWGVCGDSFSRGAIHTLEKVPGIDTVVDNIDLSWERIAARNAGNHVSCYARGGLTTRTWLTDSAGYTRMVNDTAKQLYFIMLGINDISLYGSAYIGTSADIDLNDYTQNVDSLYGNLGKMIALLKIKSPNCKIVVIGLVDNNDATRLAYNAAMKDTADIYGVAYFSQSDDPFYKSSYYANGMQGGHPTAPVLSGMAMAIDRLFSKCVHDYYSYFKGFYWDNNNEDFT